MNLKNIIKESIDKILIENAQFQFQQLGGHYQKLQYYRERIKKTDLTSTGNREIIGFIGHEFYNFVVAVEQALKRCITAGNINEAYSKWNPSNFGLRMPQLQDFGFRIPQELNNAWYSAKAGYRTGKNLWNGNKTSQNAKVQHTNNGKNYQNQKLLALLTNEWPQIQQKFINLNIQYNFGRICPDAVGAKIEIDYIVQIVQNIRNAQGTNP